jgi:hypothetical protein
VDPADRFIKLVGFRLTQLPLLIQASQEAADYVPPLSGNPQRRNIRNELGVFVDGRIGDGKRCVTRSESDPDPVSL